MSEEYETELYTDSDDTYTTLNISQISAGGYHSAINVNKMHLSLVKVMQ